MSGGGLPLVPAEPPPARVDDGGTPDMLHLSLSTWEGPLDLLLALARSHRVDLAAISILELVDQYVAVIRRQRSLRLEVAAEWLVMAAWLAYLKSLLLLPQPAEAEPDAAAMAEALRWRLRRLAAMREAGERLQARPQLGRDLFLRGAPEGLRTVRASRYDVALVELLRAYGAIAVRRQQPPWVPPRAPVVSVEEALDRLSAMLGQALDWTELSAFLVPADGEARRRSALASGLVAALELARQGAIELAQEAPFRPLFLRRRGAAG